MNDWSVHEDHGARGTGRARVGARGSNFEGRGTALETAEQQPREGAGQPPRTQTNRGSAARQRAHARARLQCSQKWAPLQDWSAAARARPTKHIK